MKAWFSRETFKKGLIVLGIFTVVGFFASAQFWLAMASMGKPIPNTDFILRSLINWSTWALLTPVIYYISRVFPIRAASIRTDIVLNLSVSILFILGKSILDEFLAFLTGSTHYRHFSLTEQLGNSILSPGVFMFLLVYWVIMAVIYSLEYNRRLKEREIASSQLEAQLALANLNALKMQLQPHFLFNTLNSISSLLRKDVDAADEMIINLSDMLRYSLNTGSKQEVPLREELDFLRHYLDIEEIRFQNHLTVDFKIEPAALDAWVPTMFLQPLVENSIRHGVSKQLAPGRVALQARRLNGQLEITVLDTGAGFSPEWEHKGIGLSNTRKRLENLYGASYSLEYERSQDEETVVRVTIPFNAARTLPEN